MATLHSPIARCPSSSSARRDDADRVGEVHDPRAGCRSTGDLLGELEQHRHRPKRLGEAAWPRRLLADRAELVGQRLVDQSSLLAADAQLDQHEVGAVERLRPVAGDRQLARPTTAAEHPPGQSADDLAPLGIDVEQRQLVGGQSGRAPRDAVNELRGVGAAPTHDRDLDAHSDSTLWATREDAP